MAREKDGYRENLEILNERFPDYDMLSITDVMQVTGYKRATVMKYLGEMFVHNRISKAHLARYMCG